METKIRNRPTYLKAAATPQGKAIYTALIDIGISLNQWCIKEGLHPKNVSDLLTGHRKGLKSGGREIKKKLSEAFGVVFDEAADE